MARGSDQITIDVLGNTRPLEKDIARVANQALILNTKGFSAPLGKISGQLGEFEKSLAASNARVIAFGASAGAIYAVQRAFEATIKSVIDVEKALTDINVILNVNQQTLTKFGKGLFDIAKNTGTSFAEVTKAAVEFSRQGLGVEDTLKRTSDALILTRLSGLDVVSSTEAITAALNSFNQTAINSNQLISKLAAVDAAFAVSSADLAEAVKRVGSSAQDAGVSLDELLALVTSAQQITSRGGAVIGNSFKTIFTRLQRPVVLDALEQLGVKTKDAENNTLPLIQILNQLSRTFDTLTSNQKAQIAELVGGVFQINILKASLSDLSKEYSIFGRALEISTSATDEANQRNEALNQTLSATISKTLANLQSAATEIGNLAFAPALQRALGGLNTVLENFGTSSETESIGSKIGEGLVRGLGNFLSGPGLLLGLATVFKIFERLAVFSADAFKTISGINTQNATQQTLQTQILNLIGKNPQIIEQINKGNISTTQLHNQILNLIQQETVAMERQVALAASLAKSLSAVGVTVPASGPFKGAAVTKNKSFGYIPNFASEEIMGAYMGGYTPGNIKEKSISGYGRVTYNTAESIKKFPGLSQPAIMPPKQSKAGKIYKNNFANRLGFDPYAAKGFIPNFANTKESESYSVNGRIGMLALYGKGGDSFKATTSLQQLGFFNDLIKNNPDLADNRVTFDGIQIRSFENLNKNPQEFTKDVNKVITPGLATLAQKYIGTILGDDGSEAVAEVAKNLGGAAILPPGAEGDIFESVVKFATKNTAGFIKSVSDDFRRPFDFEEAGVASQVFKTAFGFGGSLEKADAKRTATDEQIRSLIKKAYNSGSFTDLPYYDMAKSAQKGAAKELPASYRKSGKRQAVSKYLGFIPNFASIEKAQEKAFRAEQALGGNPGLAVKNGMLFAYDKDTQSLGSGPSMSKIKRDHPEGLNNAAKRSYGIQKSMASFGFIPNFAPVMSPEETSGNLAAVQRIVGAFGTTEQAVSKLTQSVTIADRKVSTFGKLFDDDQLPANLKKIKNNLGLASIGISIAGGFFSGLVTDNQNLQKNIDGFSQVLSTAATAAMLIPGPVGIGVAALTALASAATFVAKTLKQQGPDLEKAFEETKKSLTDFTSSTNSYSQILQKLSEAYTNSKTPVETLNQLNQQLIDAAGDIPEEYRIQLLSITDNIELQQEINKIQADLAKNQRNLEFASKYSAKLLDAAFSTPNVFKTLSELDSAAKEVILGFSKEGKNKFIENIEAEAGNLLNKSGSEFIKYLSNIYDLNENIANTLEKANPEELDNLRTSLIRFGQDLKRSKDLTEATKGAREEEINKQKELRKATEDASKGIESLNESLLLLINSAIQGENFKQDFQRIQKESLKSIDIAKASGLVDLQSEFSSNESINRVKSQIESIKRNEEFLKSARETFSEAKGSITSISTDLLSKLRNPTEGQEKFSEDLISKFENTLLDLTKQNLAPEDFGSSVKEAISSIFGKNLEDSTQIQQKIDAEIRGQQQKLALLGQQQKTANEIAKNALSIQQQMLQNQRDLNTFGGVEAFINPQKNLFEKFFSSLELYRKGGTRGENGVVEKGRGAAGLLSETISLVGGAIDEKFLKGLEPLKRQATSGRSRDIKQNALALAKVSPEPIARIFKEIAGRSDKIAEKQIDSLVKSENFEERTASGVESIQSILQTIVGSQAQGTGQIQGSVAQAITAIGTDLSPKIEGIRGSLERANQIYESRVRLKEESGKLGQENLRSGATQAAIEQNRKDTQSLLSQLEQANIPAEIKTFLVNQVKAALASGQGVPSLTDLKSKFLEQNMAAVGPNPSGAIASATKYRAERQFNPASTLSIQKIFDDFKTNSDRLKILQQSLETTQSSITSLNDKVIDTTEKLKSLGETVPENINNQDIREPIPTQIEIKSKGIDLNIPENPIDFNVAGNINVNPIQFSVSLDTATSDLTSLIAPIAEKISNDTRTALKQDFDKQIAVLKSQISDLGGKRQPPSVI